MSGLIGPAGLEARMICAPPPLWAIAESVGALAVKATPTAPISSADMQSPDLERPNMGLKPLSRIDQSNLDQVQRPGEATAERVL